MTSPISVKVRTSNNGGHSPNAIAEMCVDRLIRVSDSAPPEISQQARAYRQQMLEIVRQYVMLAVMEDRNTVSLMLVRAGMPDLAKQIKDL
jgi:hypothetical protein